MGFSILGLIALGYLLFALMLILGKSTKRSKRFKSFLAIAFSAPTILVVFFLTGHGLAYISGCEIAYSFNETNKDCLLGNWNLIEMMGLTRFAQLGLMIGVPVWFVVFVIVYAVSTFFLSDEAES